MMIAHPPIAGMLTVVGWRCNGNSRTATVLSIFEPAEQMQPARGLSWYDLPSKAGKSGPMDSKSAQMDFKNYVANDKLHDGRLLNTRSVRPDDKPILVRGLHNLSKEARYFRFFTHKEAFSDEELAYFTELDFSSHVGLLAFLVESETNTERAVAIGRYIVSLAETTQAEVAFVVKEEYRGLGIGSILLKHLVEIGRTQGLQSFIAFVMPDNAKMLRVFRKSGLPMQQTINNVGVFEINLSLKN